MSSSPEHAAALYRRAATELNAEGYDDAANVLIDQATSLDNNASRDDIQVERREAFQAAMEFLG